MEEPDQTRNWPRTDVTQRDALPALVQHPVPPELTQAMPAHPGASAKADPFEDETKRRQVEAELSRLGMSPAEVKRLLDAKASGTPGAPAGRGKKTAPTAAPPPRPSAASLQSFAADLAASTAKDKIRAASRLSLDLPEFRDSSREEVRQAEQLLRDASVLRRREKYREAKAKCCEAIMLVPRDAAALELLGDIYQGIASTDEATAAYKRAIEADPKRLSAEKKYGDLLIRQQGLMAPGGSSLASNAYVPVLLSVMLPGAGQILNGEWIKAGCFFAADLICLYLLFWSPWGFGSRHRGEGLGPGIMSFFFFAAVIYVVALIDTNADAKAARGGSRPRSGGSGWEV